VLFNVLGGLQILPSAADANLHDDSAWQFVPPAPGCAIINMGDSMVKFSNGLLRSNLHRVTYAPGDQAALDRYSLAYFARPEDQVILKRLEGSDVIPPLADGVVEKEMTSLEWVEMKGTAAKRGDSMMASSGGDRSATISANA
jgi:isopenicillin N synthase-like dioxygenase